MGVIGGRPGCTKILMGVTYRRRDPDRVDGNGRDRPKNVEKNVRRCPLETLIPSNNPTTLPSHSTPLTLPHFPFLPCLSSSADPFLAAAAVANAHIVPPAAAAESPCPTHATFPASLEFSFSPRFGRVREPSCKCVHLYVFRSGCEEKIPFEEERESLGLPACDCSLQDRPCVPLCFETPCTCGRRGTHVRKRRVSDFACDQLFFRLTISHLASSGM